MSSRSSSISLAVALAGVLILGCSGNLHYLVPGTEKANGADAEINAQVNSGQATTKLDIRVTHLTPPGRIVEGADTFVVWFRRDNSAPFTRIGNLNYDMNSREGLLQDVTVPEVAFQLIISTETGPGPGAPSSAVVVDQVVEK